MTAIRKGKSRKEVEYGDIENQGIDPEIVGGDGKLTEQEAKQLNGLADVKPDLHGLDQVNVGTGDQPDDSVYKAYANVVGGGGPGGPDGNPGDDLQLRYHPFATQPPTGQQGPSLEHPSGGHGNDDVNTNANIMNMMSAERYSTGPSVGSKRRSRLGWSEDETRNLMEGCRLHGVGNWKKILTDPQFRFNGRTAVDLKDRFRTSFPEEYSRLYPNARTHKSKKSSGHRDLGPELVKINRKERRSFTPDEDERLLQGFLKHGPAWSKIQRDTSLGLFNRRSTDLRDRFRNAFPERYAAAGYKGRATKSQRDAAAVAAAVSQGELAALASEASREPGDDLHASQANQFVNQAAGIAYANGGSQGVFYPTQLNLYGQPQLTEGQSPQSS
jgi:hypothetical protein